LKTTYFKSILILTFLVVTGCAAPLSKTNHVTSINSLTGLPGENGLVLAVKIDDTSAAHPQIGIDGADVVYIEQVEGGLTRLAAIFTSKYPTQVGPIRSARISDLDILAQYGKVAFAYSGAQKKFRPKIAQANLVDLGAEHEPPTIYARDKTRVEPTDMILNAPALIAKAKTEGKEIDSAKSVGWEFGTLKKPGNPIISATVKWPASRYSFTWSDTQKRWLINYLDKPDLDSTGLQLGAQNIVIQMVSITDSEYHDKVGGVTPFSATVGTGTGYLLRDGQVIAIKWNRSAAESGTTFTTESGEVAKFAPGQIWIALTDKTPNFLEPKTMETSTTKSK
jgi:Protein of unknown function (DUF3048) N-terminal domain/Protein of unknown function (DUF3048) C-terminal domain